MTENEELKWHQTKRLSDTEKKILSFLDSSKKRDRSGTYYAMIRWWGGETKYTVTKIMLYRGTVKMFIDPMYIISLLAKKYIKISSDAEVYLDTKVTAKRAQSGLRTGGYYDHITIDDFE